MKQFELIIIQYQYSKMANTVRSRAMKDYLQKKLKAAQQISQQNSISNIRASAKKDQFQKLLLISQKLKQLILKVKVTRLKTIYINKLKQNAHIRVQNHKKKDRKKTCVQISKIFEAFYHLIILFDFFCLVIMLFISSWAATLNNFHQYSQISLQILGLKLVSLIFFVLHGFTNFWSHLIKQYYQLNQWECRSIREDLVSFHFINTIARIIMLILFIVYPNSMVIAALFFVELICALGFDTSDLSHLKAAYIHTQRKQFLSKLMQIFLINLIVIHLVATILMAIVHINEENNWFVKFDLMHVPWFHQYTTSFYWATILVTTIGLGDISPQTKQEQIIISFLCLAACIFLAFNIATFGTFFAKFRENNQLSQQKMVAFRRILRRDYKNNVDIDLRVKKDIKKYIESLNYDKTELQFTQKNSFLNQLPQKLRNAYYATTNKRLFSSVLFINCLSNLTLTALSQKFTVSLLQAQTKLVLSDQQILLLEQGQVNLTYFRKGSTRNGQVLDVLKIGKRQNICLLSTDFLSLQKKTNFNLETKQFSIVWNMKFEQFINILKNNTMDFEYYFSILHRHQFDDGQWRIMDCPRCYTADYPVRHCSSSCPYLSYIPLRSFIIQKSFNYEQINQPRQNFSRRKFAAPRTSVLKYWNKYLRNNYQMQRKRDERSHINIILKQVQKTQKQKVQKVRQNYTKQYNNYYMDKKRQQIFEYQNFVSQVGIPFNFQFYMPAFNPDKFIFTSFSDLYEANRIYGDIGIFRKLKNVLHVKCAKFDFQQP